MAELEVSRLMIGAEYDDEESIDEDISASEDEDDEDSQDKHKNLLKAIGSLDGTGKKRKSKIPQRSEPYQKASEFHLSAPGNELEKVQLHELIGSLNNSSSHGEIKKKLESMEQKSDVLDVPLSKPQAERIQRVIAYEEVSKNLNKWESTVKKNRQAEHLSFPLNPYQPQRMTTKSVSVNFKPMTPLEQEVAAVLRGSSQILERTKKELTVEEEEALKAMDLDEAQERLKELQRLRALQSYYEQKCRRNKKIKSKKYHKIKRKGEEKAISKLSLEELEEKDPEKFHHEMEKMEKSRIMERMSLKHRNTSKWAKQLMIKGAKDKEARKALSEQLKLSRQLTEKTASSSSDEDEEEDAGEDGGGPPVSILIGDSDNPWMMAETEEKIKAVQQPNEPSGKVRRLQPITAKDTHEDEDVKDSNEEDEGKDLEEEEEEFELLKVVGKKKRKKKRKTTLKRKNTETEGLDCSSYVEKNVERDNEIKKVKKAGDKIRDVEKRKKKTRDSGEKKSMNKNEKKKTKIENENDSEPEDLEGAVEKVKFDHELMEEVKIDERSIQQGIDEVKEDKSEKETQTSNIRKEKRKAKQSKSDVDVRVDPKKIFTIEDHGPKLNLQNTNDVCDQEEDQRINIIQAFANDDVVEEFIQEKNDVTEASKPKDVDLTLPGWGDWGGVGIEVSAAKRKRFTIPAAPAPVRKDSKMAHVIINEERNKRFAKSQVKELPHPFTSYSQYERSMRTPVGKHWNTESITSKLIKPRINTLPGTIIDPMKPTKEVKNWKPSDKQRGKERTENSSLVIHN